MKLFLILALLSGMTFSQIRISSVGGYLGGGSINGNSPQVASFATTLFFDVNTDFTSDVNFRFSFLYAGDIRSIVPDNSANKYYSFERGLSLKAVIQQDITQKVYLNEGVGLLLLNDRTYSFVNNWCYGVLFSGGLGIFLFDHSIQTNGFTLGLDYEYGLTFTQTLPAYFSINATLKYLF
jgi:hypothetical protein